MGYHKFPFQVNSSWFKGACNITTYSIEELLGTKLRALYQRRKGRDLFDLFKALVQIPDLDKKALLQCYHAYMVFGVAEPPTSKEYLQNLEAKIRDDEFTGDITALLRPTEKYDPDFAFEYVCSELLGQMDVSKYNYRVTPP